jgi:hypothetical protein
MPICRVPICREGNRIFEVEFEADDIAAIPMDGSQKIRLHKLKVVAELDLEQLGLK